MEGIEYTKLFNKAEMALIMLVIFIENDLFLKDDAEKLTVNKILEIKKLIKNDELNSKIYSNMSSKYIASLKELSDVLQEDLIDIHRDIFSSVAAFQVNLEFDADFKCKTINAYEAYKKMFSNN